jgi:hypothetical protein
MYYATVEKSLQTVLEQTIPLSSSQLGRIRDLAIALLLAGETPLGKLARQLPQLNRQDSRIRWIKRLLEAPFMTQEYVYQPWIGHLLQTHPVERLHLVIDRTAVLAHQLDLLSINVNFRNHALPLVWQVRPTGMTSAVTQKHLLNRCVPLIPADRQVVLHGDNEFGSVEVMQWARAHGWDFIVGQAATTYFRLSPTTPSQQLAELPVTPTQAIYRPRVELTKAHWFGPVNLFAFYQPVYHRNRRKQAIRYYATSLPSSPAVRRIGKRRWGIECFSKTSNPLVGSFPCLASATSSGFRAC